MQSGIGPADAARRHTRLSRHRKLQTTTDPDPCLVDGPQAEANITLVGFSNQTAVESVLDEIFYGDEALPLEDGTDASELICSADSQLAMVAPASDTMDTTSAPVGGGGGGKKMLAVGVIGAVIAAVGMLVLLMVGVFVVRKRRAGNPSAVHPSSRE